MGVPLTIIAGHEVHLGRPEVHWGGECEPLADDPCIIVDSRLPRTLQWAVALHEIAHVRGRVKGHGSRFRRSLTKLWREEAGVKLRWFGGGEWGLLATQLVGLGSVLWNRLGA